MAIKARKDSPEWLEEEVAHTRTGLMHLRQNVVLLHNPDEPDSFYPVLPRTALIADLIATS